MSMLFFSQKVLRKMPGNWSFVIVTDRDDLDDQAYKEFLYAGVVTEKHMRATGSAHLRQLLGEDHRYVFTLIQKFRTEKGETHPVISDRDDVIVITDEAHRTQYDTLALNMRNALPNAGFLGFTGTPLIAGEERTREVFGDYVSVYNFAASAADHATVPLYFENRIPQLEIANPTFGDDLMAIVEEADLDEDQERQLARTLGQQYELITRDDRLDAVAKDIVDHFLGRGFPGKAMVVSIDKVTAVRTYDKVQRYWAERLEQDEHDSAARGPRLRAERDLLEQEIAFMREHRHGGRDLAVPERDRRDGRARARHQAPPQADGRGGPGGQVQGRRRTRSASRSSARCGRPGSTCRRCSTVYLDKPLRNHTLMQTITRANRVFPEKNNGLIVAYVDVFQQSPEGAGDLCRRRQGRARCRSRRRARSSMRSARPSRTSGPSAPARDVDLDALGQPEGLRAGRGRQADRRDADGRRRREDRLPVACRAGQPPLQGDPARQAGQRVQPGAGGVQVPRRRHRRLHRARPTSPGSWAGSSSSSTSPSPPTST